MAKTPDYPKTTNLAVPPDVRDTVLALASEEDGRTYKGMLMVLIREALAARQKRK